MPASPDDMAATMVANMKSKTGKTFEQWLAIAKKTGAEKHGQIVKAPKKTYVSLRRNKQFAIVQPSTRTRVDLGLNLKDEKAAGRLEKSGSFNAMVTHRVRLEKPADVDKDVIAWLKKAWAEA
jgi:hypothetical protein